MHTTEGDVSDPRLSYSGVGIEVGPRFMIAKSLEGFHVAPLVFATYGGSDSVSGAVVAPGLAIGHAWRWNNGLFLDAYISVHYLFFLGDLKPAPGFRLVQPMLHTALGYAW